jgi:hypothetical protein
MISTCVLIIVSLIGTILQFSTIAPDIFGYASSFTLDNPYTDIPPEAQGCTLDGIERARLLKDVRVQFADVRPGDEVGHIAFATCGFQSEKKPNPFVRRYSAWNSKVREWNSGRITR